MSDHRAISINFDFDTVQNNNRIVTELFANFNTNLEFSKNEIYEYYNLKIIQNVSILEMKYDISFQE